jgi:glutamate/tyrosine decarboxylase-like PLP-dependent enzyme
VPSRRRCLRSARSIVDPPRLDGLALADSISLDPHKWLYQPLDCSLLLYRDAEVARQARLLARLI